MRIVCPTCKAELADVPEDFGPRPFCSTRCKLVDLGNWLNESYRVSTPAPREDREDDHKLS